MKTAGNTLLLLMLLILGSCDKEESQNDELISSDFVKCWIHSFEEDMARDQDIFRPCDYTEFPSSRYRQIYNFMADGTCTYSVLAPNDGHFTDSGNWEFEETEQKLTITKDGEIIRITEVTELDDTIMSFWK